MEAEASMESIAVLCVLASNPRARPYPTVWEEQEVCDG